MLSQSSQKTILVVDDNPGDLGLLRQVLEHVTGIVVQAVPNVAQAHAFLTRLRPYQDAPTPDLIFLDLRMPMRSGHAIISLVKRELKLAETKVVVFTSSMLDTDRIQCEELGADDYVCKPNDWSEWQIAIDHVLRRHRLLVS